MIGASGEQLGVLPLEQALSIAQEQGFDLVLMNSSKLPFVCKLMDYSKYRFDAIKKEKELRKNQKVQNVKEIQLSMRIDEHDVSYKLKNAQKFLENGDKVKVTLRMRGRESARSDDAVEMVNKFAERLQNFGVVEKNAQILGKIVNVVISPKK